MTSTASAPAKVILFGEHFVVYGVGAILCSIDRRVSVSASATGGKKIRISSEMGDATMGLRPEPGEAPHAAPVAFVAREMIRRFGHAGGLDIDIRSEVPPGAGLGSSSACCVAAAAAVSGLFARLPKDEILEIATRAERTILAGASGADGAACTYGGIITYDVKRGAQKLTAAPGIRIIVANSGEAHSTAEMVSRAGLFREENPGVFGELCRKESGLVRRAGDALRAGDARSLGREMSENQSYLERIGVSGRRLREIIGIADMTGYGSKITGAGGGGCIISAAAGRDVAKTMDALRGCGCECFETGIGSRGLDTFLTD